MKHITTRLASNSGTMLQVESFVQRHCEARMLEYSGTVFLHCRPEEEPSAGFFAQAAEESGRRLFRQEEYRGMEPEALAALPEKKAILASYPAMAFLDKYLDACPAGERHLLICLRRQGERPRIHRLFHDFWEERAVDIEDLYTETGPEEL